MVTENPQNIPESAERNRASARVCALVNKEPSEIWKTLGRIDETRIIYEQGRGLHLEVFDPSIEPHLAGTGRAREMFMSI